MVLKTPNTKANYYCLMADQQDALELSSCQDHCQSFFSQQTSDITSRYLFINFYSFRNKYAQIPWEIFESSVKTSGKNTSYDNLSQDYFNTYTQKLLKSCLNDGCY